MHGVVNEILAANADPAQYREVSGFAHEVIQSGKSGHKREIDFHLEPFDSATPSLFAEVK